VVEPPERVAQVGFGIQRKGEPTCAGNARGGVEARVGLGALQERGQHGIEFQNEGGCRADSACAGERGEYSFSFIDGAEAKHGLCSHAGPGEEFRFEQRRPLAHLFGNGEEFRPRASRLLTICLGLEWFHGLFKWPSPRDQKASDEVAAR